MTYTKTFSSAATALALITTSAYAEELNFSKLYIVGDSLSDGGVYSQSVRAGSGFTLPDIPYQFLTNAPDGSSQVWAAVLADRLGISLQPNVINGIPAAQIPDIAVGGTNFAEGGARVADPAGIGVNVPGGITARPLATQVDRLLAQTPTLGKNDLVILWGGSNDVFAQLGAVGAGAISPTQAAINMAQAGSELASQVARLRGAGAETVIVVTIPDIGQTPFGTASGPASAGLATQLGNTFNAQLASDLNGSAVIVDAEKLLSAIRTDPARYGFTATDAASLIACPGGNSLTCIQGVNALPDSEQRIFADNVHPTTAAHELFGGAAFAGLQAATQAGAVPLSILTAVRQHALSLEARLNPTVLVKADEDGNIVRREVGNVDVYGGFEGGSFSADAQQVTPGIDGDTFVTRFGADVVVAPSATLGFGLSIDKGSVDFDNGGSFDSDLLIGAVFGQVALSETYYLNAAVGTGDIDVDDFTRRFTLGPATEVYTGDTTGDYDLARIGGGAMFRVNEGLLINPFASFTYEKVSIDGFSESAGAASVSYGSSEIESQRLSLGVSAFITPSSMPGWSVNLRGSVEHDFNDDDLKVSVGPNAASLGTVAAPRPDQTWGYISGSLVRDLSPGAFVALSASSTLGLSGSDGLVGGLSFKFSF